MGGSYLRDTLLVLSAEQNGPCDTAGVLALQEEGFGLSILEAEDLAVSTDVELALFSRISIHSKYALLRLPMPPSLPSVPLSSSSPPCNPIQSISSSQGSIGVKGGIYLSWVDLLAGEGVVVGTHVCWYCRRRLLVVLSLSCR